MKSFNLIIPIFNEEKNIENLIVNLNKSFLIKNDRCQKIILVNDGSYDNTSAILNSFKLNKKFQILTHDTNKGYGSALKTGIKFSISLNVNYVVFIDSDLTNPIKDIEKIIPFFDKDIDFIQGDRINAGLELLPLKRRFFTKFGNLIANFFMRMKITDYTGGFRAVKTSLYRDIELNENDFSIILEEKFKLKDKIKSISSFNTKIFVRNNNIRETSFNYSLPLLSKYLFYAIIAVIKKRLY